MPWKPSEPGEVPTLGWYVIDWMTEMLAAPDRLVYEPFVPYLEQEDFILRYYELDPITGRRKKRRGVLSRARGWGKSPLLGGLAIVEALADVVPDGWDANGQPVGRPWRTVRTPRVGVLAVSELQTANTWNPMLEMLEGPVGDEYPGLEPLDTFVNLPGRGKIEPWTSSARSVKGAPFVFAVMDQTEEWVKSNGGHTLFQKVKNNTAKTGGSFIESPNAFIPGEDSVAERTAQYCQGILEGRALDDGLHYDHREAPPETDLWQRESLLAGLRYSYGDASAHEDGCVLHDPPCPPGHEDLDHLVATIWDSTSDVQVSRSDFLNQITYASDSWVSQIEWSACGPTRGESPPKVNRTDPVTLGFDGSKSRKRGVADATALVATRVSDGFSWLLAAWEQPDNEEDWEVPAIEVDAAVDDAFKTLNVVGFYADPAKYESYVAKWEAKYGKQLKVKAGQKHPIEWWINSGRSIIITRAIDKLHTAIVEAKEFSHDGGLIITRHVLNARNRKGPSGMWIAKEHPDSSNKIDAAWALVASYAARIDALAAGLGRKAKPAVPQRIR
jgi:hypothetical protein